VATLSIIGLRVKTLDLCCLGDGGACCVITSLGALSWSLGLLNLMAASVASLMLLSLGFFYLLERGTSHTLCRFDRLTLFIKKNESDWAPPSRHPGRVRVQGDRRRGPVNNKVIRECAFGQRVRQLDGFRCTAADNLVENDAHLDIYYIQQGVHAQPVLRLERESVRQIRYHTDEETWSRVGAERDATPSSVTFLFLPLVVVSPTFLQRTYIPGHTTRLKHISLS
jgi:hypothetical protein